MTVYRVHYFGEEDRNDLHKMFGTKRKSDIEFGPKGFIIYKVPDKGPEGQPDVYCIARYEHTGEDGWGWAEYSCEFSKADSWEELLKIIATDKVKGE